MLQKLALCYQVQRLQGAKRVAEAEVMYRNFEVKKLEMVKAALGDQMPKKNSKLGRNLSRLHRLRTTRSDLVKALYGVSRRLFFCLQVEPFQGYSDDYSFRGYSFWLRKELAM